MDPSEIPAPEVDPEIPPETPPAPVPAPQDDAAAAPPAADLVINGDVTDERALALDRQAQALVEREARLRGEETTVAERERKLQEREAALVAAPTPAPKPPKVKRSRGWTDPVFDDEE